MKEERGTVWGELHLSHQKKVKHMLKVVGDCSKHKECCEVEQLRRDRHKAWMDTMYVEVDKVDTDGTSLGDLVGGYGGPGQPQSHTYEEYMSRKEDLENLSREENEVVRRCQAHNKCWGKQQ